MTSHTLFTSAEDMRSVVKINASIPWSSMLPYLDSAWTMYLHRYFSSTFLTDMSDTDTLFWGHVRRAVGPLAVYLSADEMSISIGDSGITVQNDQGKRSPASDTKIAAAKHSLLLRGYAALSDAIRYVLTSSISYDNCPRLMDLKTLLIPDIDTFEKSVSLGGDYISFFEMVPLLRGIQTTLRRDIGEVLFASLFTSTDAAHLALRNACCDYMAYRCAELHTSMATRQQRSKPSTMEWRPVIRPLYSDVEASGSFYASLAADALSYANSLMEANAEAFGIGQGKGADEFNKPGRHIFNIYG